MNKAAPLESARAMMMRGGSSKGLYFLAEDVPAEPAARDAFLLRALGSPDPRQIDGAGGGDPLTSKVAIVRRSERPGVDIDYLFLQVMVDRPIVSDGQNCGNILAGVAPFAIERGLVAPQGPETRVTLFMENSGARAVATVETPGGRVRYEGAARIDGAPGTAAPIPLEFPDAAGSTCGALLPTGRPVDRVEGLDVTLIDAGMPCVVVPAEALGVSGRERPEALEANRPLRARLESLRLACGPLMTLGDVSAGTVPKMTLVSPPRAGGAVATRTFIPHRCHAAIGVFGAVSVATACLLPGAPAAEIASVPAGDQKTLMIEHPSGAMGVAARLGSDGAVLSTAVLRTARKIFDGAVFAGPDRSGNEG